MKIHSSAQIDPNAELGEGVEVGPFAVVEAGVTVGDGCRILGHAQVLAGVRLGEKCEVGHGAVVGGDPQDFKFDRDTTSGVEVPSSNTTWPSCWRCAIRASRLASSGRAR